MTEALPEQRGERDDERQRRQNEEEVGHAHEHAIERPELVPGGDPDDGPDDHRERRCERGRRGAIPVRRRSSRRKTSRPSSSVPSQWAASRAGPGCPSRSNRPCSDRTGRRAARRSATTNVNASRKEPGPARGGRTTRGRGGPSQRCERLGPDASHASRTRGSRTWYSRSLSEIRQRSRRRRRRRSSPRGSGSRAAARRRT